MWEDNWCDMESLATKIPYIYSITLKTGASIAECWVGDQQAWDLGIGGPLFDKELGNLVKLIAFLNDWVVGSWNDRMKWKIDPYGHANLI